MELGAQKRAEYNGNMGESWEERKREKLRMDGGMERGE